MLIGRPNKRMKSHLFLVSKKELKQYWGLCPGGDFVQGGFCPGFPHNTSADMAYTTASSI